MPARFATSLVAGDYPTSSAFLTGATRAASYTLGFPGLKFFFSPSYATDFPGQTGFGSPTSLTELAESAPFVEVFSDPNITYFYLNCWTFANGITNPWTVGTANLDAEYTEIYNLAVHLRTTYPTKKFVLQCWEGDWSLLGAFVEGKSAPQDRHQRMVAFYRRWRRAINDALVATTGAGEVSFGIEINRTLDGVIDRVWYRILPEIAPDAISLSSYESINTWGANQTDALANIEALTTRLIKKIRQVMPGTRMYIGEFGWPENQSDFISKGLDAGGLLNKVIQVADAQSLTDVIYWQIFDNEEISPGNPRGYYLYKRDSSYSQAGSQWLINNGKTEYDEFQPPLASTNMQLVATDFTNTTWVDREGSYNATEVGSVSDGTSTPFSSKKEVYGFSAANYFSLAANAAHEVTTTSQRTWDFIIRADDGVLLGRYTVPYGGAVELAIAGGFATGVIYDDTGLGAYRFVSGATALTPGDYYRVTFVLDSSADKFRVYINSALDGDTTGTTGSLTPGSPGIYFIGNSNGNNFPFAGRIVEFSRHTVALTDQEIDDSGGLFNVFRGY